MKYGKVLTYKDAEEARKLIGKKVAVSDNLFEIEEHTKERNTSVLRQIYKTDNDYTFPFRTERGDYQFISEVIEEPQLMTNRQLMEWLARGNGEYTYKEKYYSVYMCHAYNKSMPNEPVSDSLRIRPWDSEEWVLPTVDIYERDCKGGN